MIKTSLMLGMYASSYLACNSHVLSILLIILTVSVYQEVVALFCGVMAIPAMDQACFVSSSKSHVNFMNCMAYDRSMDPSIVLFNMEKAIKYLPKFHYKVVEILGDYYY